MYIIETVNIFLTLSAKMKRMPVHRFANELVIEWSLPVRNVAQVALGVRVRHPGVPHPGHGQLVGGPGQAPVAASSPAQRGADGGPLRILLLLLQQRLVRRRSVRYFLLHLPKSEESARNDLNPH